MHATRILAVSALLLAANQATGTSITQTPCNSSSVGPVLWMPAMNVFRRFSGEAEPIYRFYSEVLGFEALTTYDVGNSTQVWRIKAGASELKLSRRDDSRTYVSGGVTSATGLRLWSFFFSDEMALSSRFRRANLPLPIFKDLSHQGQYKSSAIVSDPDGHPVELIITGDPSGTKYDKIEIGVVVSDITKSLAFYRDFVGLDQLSSEDDLIFNTTKYVLRHGSTIVTLRSFTADLPADTGSGGIQYVVSDAHRVDELAKCNDITIDKPLGGIPGFNITTIWLEDPDHITNYFAETEDSRGG